jgi:hypothetical protein
MAYIEQTLITGTGNTISQVTTGIPSIGAPGLVTRLTGIAAISTANSSTSNLGLNAVFSGTSEDVTMYAELRIIVFANQNSATDGLSIQQSSDGTNWDIKDTYTITANEGKTISVGTSGKFFRIVYTNGGVAQTIFRLQSIFHQFRTKSSSQRPQDAKTNETDTEEVLNHDLIYNGTTWDRTRSIEGVSSSTATKTGILAAGVGPGFSRVDTSQTITANSQSRTFEGKGTEQLGITISGTWTGTLTFEYTVDGSTWIVDSTGVDGNTLTQTNGVTTINGTWFFDSSAVLQYRVRSTAWTSGTANLNFIGSMGSAITYGAIIAPRPDRIGIVQTWKSYTDTSSRAAGSAVAVWTPASGKKVVITSMVISTFGTTSARIFLFFAASADATYSAGTDQPLFVGSFSPSATSKPGMVFHPPVPVVASTADFILKYQNDAALSIDITLYGYEI